jgi:hypothetical protein
MIGIVAACALRDRPFGERAKAKLDEVAKVLPGTANAVGTLAGILKAPDAARIPEALRALPFNYH